MIERLRKKLSALVELDGAEAKMAWKGYGDLGRGAAGGRGGVAGMGGGVDAGGGDDSSSCSCVYGNPCAVSYCCKDWANRFEVAKRAMEGKGGGA